MSGATAVRRALTPVCDPPPPQACTQRIAALEERIASMETTLRGVQQDVREMVEAVRCNTEASERRNSALANLERRLVLSDDGVEVRKTGSELAAIPEEAAP